MEHRAARSWASLVLSVSLVLGAFLGCSSANTPDGDGKPEQSPGGGATPSAGASSLTAGSPGAGSAPMGAAGTAASGGGATGGAGAGGRGGVVQPPGPVDGTACMVGAGSGKTLYIAPTGTATGDGASF